MEDNAGVLVEESYTPRSITPSSFTPKSNTKHISDGDSDKFDIPLVSYSDEDNDSISEQESITFPIHAKEEDSNGSDTNRNYDPILTSETPPLELELPALENEKRADAVTNELFYQVLAEIISDPIPKRDLSIFTLQSNDAKRKLVDPDRRKLFDLFVTEKYLEEVIESIMENESGFIDNLLEPVRRNPIDMLQLLQNSDLGSYEHFENISLKQPVLNLDLYLDIERNKEERRLTEHANKKL
jgi:hypothetical protein